MAALIMGAIAVPSFAAPASTYDQQILQIRYDTVSARVGFTTGVMTDIVSLVPQASDLNDQAGKLNADLSALNGYVSANDQKGFNTCVSGTINSDIKAANQAMAADRAHFREWNVTKETRQQLKTDFDSRKTTYESQIRSDTLQLGSLRLAYYNQAVAGYDGRIANLSAKGADVSGMQSVMAGARSSVISPLQSAVSAGDVNATKEELKGKCLGNGAPYSYHFWAKMDLESLKAGTARLADNATKAGHGDQITDVNAKLATVQSTLNAAGTSPYSGDQKDNIWNSLKAASEELKTVIQEMKGH